MSHAPASDAPSRVARAFLAALSQPGAVGAPDPFDATRVIVQASRGGVTMRTASADRPTVDALVAQGACVWSLASGRPRLTLAGEASPVDPFAARRPRLEATRDAEGRTRIVDMAESPLVWLARRSGKEGALIRPHALEAGERLRRDLERARMTPRVTVDWTAPSSGGGGGGPGEAMDVALAARQRARAALEAVGGDLAGLLIDVCGCLKGLETIEAERGWPRRSAKVALALALERLAAHYGYEAEARGRERVPTRSWRESLDAALAPA